MPTTDAAHPSSRDSVLGGHVVDSAHGSKQKRRHGLKRGNGVAAEAVLNALDRPREHDVLRQLCINARRKALCL